MRCPVCGQKYIGKIGRKKFFCGDCYSELVITNNKCNVFKIDENGSLVKTCEKLLKDILHNPSGLKGQYN